MKLKHIPRSQNSKSTINFGVTFKKYRIPAIFGAIFLIFFIWVIYLSFQLPSLEQLENYDPQLATKVYSADGVLIKEFFTERRFFSPLVHIPDTLIQAVLATEDHRFYDHWGLVPIRLLKVIFLDIITMSKQQGASTLTQQLARQLHLTLEKKISRKIKEMLTAIQIERTYTKPEILEMYMNHMSFAHGTYGVEAAAQLLFNKSVQELRLHECALITGMLQTPALLNPFRYPERALKRRNIVLGRMLAENVITYEQFKNAAAEDLGVVDINKRNLLGTAPYFTEYLRKTLQQEFGWDLYKGGLNIYTTLDSRVQACAEQAVAEFLPTLQEIANKKHANREDLAKLVPPELLETTTLARLMQNKALADSILTEKAAVQMALVAIDPRNGHILAMIGGRDFEESQWNRAIQTRRQPGSAFKPIVYTAAIDNGYMPSYEKLNQPIVVHQVDGTRWTPKNYDESIGGKTTLREALRRSLNLVTARLVQEDIPPQQVVEYAHNLGIKSPLDAVDAIALGSSGVTPLELTSAFGVFANRGVLVSPVSVVRVQDKYGNLLERNTPQSKGVLSEETAYIMIDMLRTVAWHGTGAASVSKYNFTRPAGGKTGTTNDYTDAWYVSITPQMAVGVWIGLDDPAMSLGDRQTGTAAALPIAATFMKMSHDTLSLPVEDFVRPDGIVDLEICNQTKLLANESCPEVVEEIFDVRYQPREICQVHSGRRNRDYKPDPKRRIHY